MTEKDLNVLTLKPLFRARQGKGNIGIAYQLPESCEIKDKTWAKGSWILFGENIKYPVSKKYFEKHYKILEVFKHA